MGVTKETTREGSGSPPSAGDYITVHCTGKLEGGKKFWCVPTQGSSPCESLDPGALQATTRRPRMRAATRARASQTRDLV